MTPKAKKAAYDKRRRLANPEMNREKCRKWRERNKHYKRFLDREYRLSHREKLRKAKSDYYQQKKDTYRAVDLRRNYGITVAEYDAMLLAQGGTCFICKGVNKNGKRLAVDHSHQRGGVRKLLCLACNLMLGNARDRAEVLRAGALYLELHA